MPLLLELKAVIPKLARPHPVSSSTTADVDGSNGTAMVGSDAARQQQLTARQRRRPTSAIFIRLIVDNRRAMTHLHPHRSTTTPSRSTYDSNRSDFPHRLWQIPT
ncbi:hypothetical protein ACLOJK_019548, partial [Asimina triloba]